MDTFMYITLGSIDILAILVLAFKVFRFPLAWKKEFLIISITASLISYLNRVVLDIPSVDSWLQYTIIILFFRYMLTVKLFDSIVIATVGYLGFNIVQYSTYVVMLWTGVVSFADGQALTNLGTYLIQVATHLFVFLIAWLIYRYNHGFSFIMVPPHDVHIKTKMTPLKFLIITMVFLSSTTILFVTNWMISFNGNPTWLVPVFIIYLIILFKLLEKKEMTND
ncbi:hypothetical protein EEL30_06345 [Brevibacillus laterosporus]|uniref:Uncharacterized protein n=1 Tax=Brevibacillus laterosporus TaxID=1465 RepID=A0A518V4V2_BRELA|nr:hypothetical protein EEL30_06345 [Brevibacillus laterosporus]